jgi:hypothetical protein
VVGNVTEECKDVTEECKNEIEEFEVADGSLIRYNGTATDVVIPDGVVEIGSKAFNYYPANHLPAIVSVSIPCTVKRIGTPGWDGWGAFGGCKNLRKINIFDSVEYLQTSTFWGCKNLEEVEITPEKLLCLGYLELDMMFNKPVRQLMQDKLKKAAKERGICWKCQTPLNLKKNGSCKKCGSKTDLS